MRFQESKEKELEKLSGEFFNECRPMVPQRKEWRVKKGDQPKPIMQVVQPDEEAIQTAGTAKTEQAVRPPIESVRPVEAEVLPSYSFSIPMA